MPKTGETAAQRRARTTLKVGKAVSMMENAEQRASVASNMRYHREAASASRFRKNADAVVRSSFGDNYDGERELAKARDTYRAKIKVHKE